MESCSSWASTSVRPAWPSISPGGEVRHPRVGRRSSAIMPTASWRWICSSYRRSSFRLLYGLLIMGHGRRQILWFGVTAHPTAEWIANQLTEACGWEQMPRYLIRDRDGVYGEIFLRRVRCIGIRDRPTSPRSPWQNACAERLICSIRRECLDYVVVLGERHLRHVLLSYMTYHNEARTHLSLDKDAPIPREVHGVG